MVDPSDAKLPFHILSLGLTTIYLGASFWSLFIYGVISNVAVDAEAARPYSWISFGLLFCAIVWGTALFRLTEKLGRFGDVLLGLSFLAGSGMCIYLLPTI